MKILQIRWQRLVDEHGETCERCGATESAVDDAVQMLKQSGKGLGIEVVLEKSTLDISTFKETPRESNRIWIGAKPLEDWLSATISESRCGSACEGENCRTLVVDGKAFEAIPSELIVKAGLLASAQLLEAEPPNGCTATECQPQTASGCCEALKGCCG